MSASCAKLGDAVSDVVACAAFAAAFFSTWRYTWLANARGKRVKKITISCIPRMTLTKKFHKIRLGLHRRPSVQRRIPLSFSSKTNTCPLRISLRSSSRSLRLTLGMMPRRTHSKIRSASCVLDLFDWQPRMQYVDEKCMSVGVLRLETPSSQRRFLSDTHMYP